MVNINTIDGDKSFYINGLKITPVKVMHYKLEVLGFRIGDFTYITDASYIAPEEMDKTRGSKGLVLNALRHEPHISHFTFEQAKEVAKEAASEVTYFTHISHQLGLHEEVEKGLPPNIRLAYDGLTLHY
jgi:phosphoribosyl 1,2-cyclic phosphate phosphodiesterase